MAEEVLSDAALHAAVVASQAEIDRLCAQQAQLLAKWDSRGTWASDGSRSFACRFARETGLSTSDARALINRARRINSMPLCFSAWSTGVLASSRLDLLVRANTTERCDVFGRDEDVLLSQVSELFFDDAKRVVQYWIQCVDESGSESRAKHLVEQRSAHVSTTFEGSVDIRALFDPVSGEQFLNELDRLERSLFKTDWAQAKEQLKGSGVQVNAGALCRTAAQRRCDALLLMATRSASSSQQDISKSPRALVSVVVDYSTFGRICEMASGQVVAPGQVVPLLQNADIERIVFDGPSRIVKDLGHKRLFTGALRRAIQVRDRHCQHESGCEVAGPLCEVDHNTAHIRGGTTSQENGRLLYSWHNKWKGAGPP